MTGKSPPASSFHRADEHFVSEQYRMHSNEVYRRCLLFGGGDAAWAEDVTHDVFLRLVEAARTLDRTNVRGWLISVAYRLCVDRYRRDGRLWARIAQALQVMPRDEVPTPHRTLEVKAELTAVAQAVSALPARERAVLLMKHVEGLSQKEIAQALGHTEGYVSKLVQRAQERLRDGGWSGLDD